MELNPEQHAAATHVDGPILVLAGAGTGKTRVLVQRIAHLVECRAEPWAILAVTFTKKAADEMRQRLRQLLGAAADAMWIGTFHATCARLLRKWPEAVGLTKHFVIFDDDDQVKLVDRLLKAHKMDELVSARSVVTMIDRAKNRGEDPVAAAQGHYEEILATIYPRYQAQLAQENAVDFNDLLLKTLALCDHAEIGRRVRTMFRHVLVDEFQDTNLVQYQLVQRLAGATRNLMVVGDDDQAIYGWRGANPKNLLEFDRDYADATVVKLEQNYRSTQVILDAANAVIGRNTERHDKRLWTGQHGGDPIESYAAGDERGEAYFIASNIRRMIDEGPYSPSDFAILYRTNAQSRVLEEHLRAQRLPAKVYGAVSFFERKEVKDVLAYLRVLANAAADSALERIVNVPARGLGETTIDRLRAAARANGTSLWQACEAAARGEVAGLSAAPRKKLAMFVEVMKGLRGVVDAGASVGELIIQVVERSGLRAKLEADDTEEARDRLANLAELVTTASDFDDERAKGAGSAANLVEKMMDGELPDGQDPWALLEAPPTDEVLPPATLDEFLERIVLTSVVDQSAPADAVSLMTVHIAKGLEFPVVFLAGMEDGLFPSLREREEQSQHAQLEEERRLAYVAITRARHRLVVTQARTRRVWGEVRFCTPSRFLDDIPDACMVASPGRAQVIYPSPKARAVRREAYDEFDQRPVDEFEAGPARGGGARHVDPELIYDAEYAPRAIEAGMRVAHAAFGKGRVVSATGAGEDRKAVVEFPSVGTKVVLARFLTAG